MSDWEADDFTPTLPIRAVPKSNWEDEDEESEPEVSVPAPAAPKSEKQSKKSLLEEKIREREERDRQRALEHSAKLESELNGLSEAERKLRLQKIVEEADMQNAKELFMDDDADEDDDDEDTEAVITLDSITLKTRKEDAKFAELVSAKIKPLYHPKRSERYIELLKELLRQTLEDLEVDDVKDISNTVNVISNDKLKKKAQAQGKKKKATAKKSVRVEHDDLEPIATRGVYGADYDDFM